MREKLTNSWHYTPTLAALRHAPPNQLVDEDQLLRMKFGAILTPILLGMRTDSSAAQLDGLARNTIGTHAESV